MITIYKIDLRKASKEIDEYVESTVEKTTAFIDQLHAYQLDRDVVERLKDHRKDFLIIVFSAEWCPDCRRDVPVLKLISGWIKKVTI